MGAHYKTFDKIVTFRDGHGDFHTITREELEGGVTIGQTIRRCRVTLVAEAERRFAEGWVRTESGRWCSPNGEVAKARYAEQKRLADELFEEEMRIFDELDAQDSKA